MPNRAYSEEYAHFANELIPEAFELICFEYAQFFEPIRSEYAHFLEYAQFVIEIH